MAVVSVKKQEFLGGSTSQGVKATATIPYVVTCNALPTRLIDLETATDGTTTIPEVGDGLDGDGTRLCTKIDVKPTSPPDMLTFIVTANYETVDPGWNQNPLLRKDTIRFEGSKESKSVFMTLDATPVAIVTTAGEPFDKLPNQTTGAFKAIIQGYRSDPGASALATYLRPNAVSDGGITVRGITFGAGELKMVSGGVDLVTENGITCWKCTWECEVAPDWVEHIDSRGFWQLVSGSLQRIVKGDPPKPVTKPWPLDSGGAALSDPTAAPAKVDAKIQPVKDFTVFAWSDTF